MADSFPTNLLRMIAGELFFSVSMQAAREMYGKSYFELGLGERGTLDQLVANTVWGNFQTLTEEVLKAQVGKQQQPGFGAPTSTPPATAPQPAPESPPGTGKP